MGMHIKLYKKIITSVKIISKLIFKFQFHQKRAHDIWRAVRSHPTHPPDTPLNTNPCEQVDRVVMESNLGPTLLMLFLLNLK